MDICAIDTKHCSKMQFNHYLEDLYLTRLKNIVAVKRDQHESVQVVIFHTFRVNYDTDTLTVSVNPVFMRMINDFEDGRFTMFELKEFISLSSSYAKNLYRLLKQYDSTGLCKVRDVDLFKKQIGCPESYDTKKFTQRILMPAVDELSGFPDEDGLPTKKVYFDIYPAKYLHSKDSDKATEARNTIIVRDFHKAGSPIVGFDFQYTAKKSNSVSPDESDMDTLNRKLSDMSRNELLNILEKMISG